MGFLQDLRNLGVTCAGDMQSFVRRVDPRTGRVSFADVPLKREIVGIAKAVKLDVFEPGYVTETADPERATGKLEQRGAADITVTGAHGVFVSHGGTTYFERFTNKNMEGRTRRGDTAYSPPTSSAGWITMSLTR